MLTLLSPSSFLPVAHQPSGLLYSQRSWVGKEKLFKCWRTQQVGHQQVAPFGPHTGLRCQSCHSSAHLGDGLLSPCLLLALRIPGRPLTLSVLETKQSSSSCVNLGRQDSLTADSVTCPGLRNLRPLNLRFDSSLEFSQQSEPDLSLCWSLPPFFPFFSYRSLLSLAMAPLPLPLPSPALVTSELFNYVFS